MFPFNLKRVPESNIAVLNKMGSSKVDVGADICTNESYWLHENQSQFMIWSLEHDLALNILFKNIKQSHDSDIWLSSIQNKKKHILQYKLSFMSKVDSLKCFHSIWNECQSLISLCWTRWDRQKLTLALTFAQLHSIGCEYIALNLVWINRIGI